METMEPLSGPHLFGLTSLNLAYGFMLSNQGLLLAPLESEHFFPNAASLGLGGFAICGGVAQLCGPAAGRWSDQTRAATGRRIPSLLKVVAVVAFLTALLPFLSVCELAGLYVTSFLLQQISWNVLQTVQVALVPDLAPASQRGTLGGMTAANILIGALCGLLAVRCVGGHASKHYFLGVALTVSCAVLVYRTTATKELERRRVPDQSSVDAREAFSVLKWARDLPDCYKFNAKRYPEFAKFLVSKSLYSASVVVKAFLLFFAQDTFRLNDLEREQVIVGNAATAAETAAALAATIATVHLSQKGLAGGESDESAGPARARRAAIAGAFWMSVFWFGLPLVGYGVQRERESQSPPGSDLEAVARHWVRWMILSTTIWGLGQGLYLCGNSAVGYALLPDRDEASRYLGLTAVYSSVGAVAGGATVGGILYTFGSIGTDATTSPGADRAGYTFPGYAAMFVFASCLCAGCFFLICSINTTKNSMNRAVILEVVA